MSKSGAPAGRYATDRALWTGDELNVWGGLSYATGMNYEPAARCSTTEACTTSPIRGPLERIFGVQDIFINQGNGTELPGVTSAVAVQ